MTTHRALRDLATALAIALALPTALAGCSEEAADQPAPTPKAEAAGPFEVQWMQSMIQHHHGAVMMSEQCVDRAAHAELRAMCEDVITAQKREIADMQGWLEDWYGIASEDPHMVMHDHAMPDLSSLQGAQFDRAYLEEMIGHHATAVDDAGECQRVAVHAELLALCKSIESSQMAEIEKMEMWQEEWVSVNEP